MSIGGGFSILTGVAHLHLPVVYPWKHHVADLDPPVRWALFATTVSFGILLVVGGLLSRIVARAHTVWSRFL